MIVRFLLRSLISIYCITLSASSMAQTINGRVVDAETHQGLPFSTIRLGTSGQGLITDIHGNFSIALQPSVNFIEASYTGYTSQKILVNNISDSITIILESAGGQLDEIVVRPSDEKIYRIIDNALSNRRKNNPEKYDWYRCHVYYKLNADVRFSPDDSIAEAELSFLKEQYVLFTETYSIRTWKQPQQLQEDVIASRFSGFKKPLFTSVVTDFLPFHSYNSYLNLNGKDYINPIAPGYKGRYSFSLADELLQGKDTLWLLNFHPKKDNVQGLTGTVYIHSDGYALANFIAEAKDEYLHRNIRLEQRYERTDKKWFPKELNYIIDFAQQIVAGEKGKKDTIQFHIVLKGNSLIDSVSFAEEKDFRFDKTHTIRLRPGYDEQTDENWNLLRSLPLDAKEQKTYHRMDSLSEALKLDRIVPYLDKIVEGKIPFHFLDMDLKRLFSFNAYEKYRIGIGLQTNDKLIRRLSVGGWFGYGTGDKEWKYGGFAEWNADQFKDFKFRLSYDYDLRDPGRLQINREIEKNYLRLYLMKRVDRISSYSFSVAKRMGYWNSEIILKHETITPAYTYTFTADGLSNSDYFTSKEAILNLRFAYAERRAPMFGKYFSTGTKYPVFYGRFTTGILENKGMQTAYLQTLMGASWNKHINLLGNERLLVLAGKSWSGHPLPISKLFAGNGFRLDASYSVYAFGGMVTMLPYEYYSDRFINIYWRHDFDWRFYRLKYSAPSLSVAHNILWGDLDNTGVHLQISFNVPGNGYHETGLVLNDLLRIGYFNLYYVTINAGYFLHWTKPVNSAKNGLFVLGLGVAF